MVRLNTYDMPRILIQALLALNLLILPIAYTTAYGATSSTTETTVTTTSSIPVTEVDRTTTTTTERRDYDTRGESRGIIGGAFHVIGTVISFPFIVVGKLLQAIF